MVSTVVPILFSPKGFALDSKKEGQATLDDLKTYLPNHRTQVTKSDMSTFDAKMTYDLTVTKENKTFEVFFNSEDAQQAAQKENLPPVIGDIDFDPTNPKSGNAVQAKTQASDPENLPITWEWTWSGAGANQKGTGDGNDLQLSGLQTHKTGKDEPYSLMVKATDALGAFTTKSKRLDAKKPDEPPQITNINIPGSMSYRGNVSVKGTGRDSDGNDNNLRWNVHRSGGDGYISGFSPYSTKGKSFSTKQYMKNNVGRYNPFTISVVLTDEDGLQSSANRRVTMNPDPLVFDLNGDGKVELVGSEMVSKGVQVPPGLWDVKVVSVPDTQSRFTVADVNQGQGEFNAQVGAVHSLNSSGRWKARKYSARRTMEQSGFDSKFLYRNKYYRTGWGLHI